MPAWISWQKLDYENKGQKLLCQQCGWPFIPYGRGHDDGPSFCDGFCPNLACPLGLTGGPPPPEAALRERAARARKPFDRQTEPFAKLRSFLGLPKPSEMRPTPSHDEKRAQRGRQQSAPVPVGQVYQAAPPAGSSIGIPSPPPGAPDPGERALPQPPER